MIRYNTYKYNICIMGVYNIKINIFIYIYIYIFENVPK